MEKLKKVYILTLFYFTLYSCAESQDSNAFSILALIENQSTILGIANPLYIDKKTHIIPTDTDTNDLEPATGEIPDVDGGSVEQDQGDITAHPIKFPTDNGGISGSGLGVMIPPEKCKKTVYYLDQDLDNFGYNGNYVCGSSTDPLDYGLPASTHLVTAGNDCNDSDFSIRPGAPEYEINGDYGLPDGIDNNCNGQIDEPNAACGEGFTVYAFSIDGDDFGAQIGDYIICVPNGETLSIEYIPIGLESMYQVTLQYPEYHSIPPDMTDCDDIDANTYPSAAEIQDGKDNDCDGKIDENPEDNADCSFLEKAVYFDRDVDSYGSSKDEDSICVSLYQFYVSPPIGTSKVTGDCNDNNNLVYPNAKEQPYGKPDGIDNNCNGEIDELVHGNTCGAGYYEYYHDMDNDGDGSENGIFCSSVSISYTSDSDQVAGSGGDCNDSDPMINSGMKEIEDGKDNDCDGVIDEKSCDDPREDLYYYDNDSDAHGAPGNMQMFCYVPGTEPSKYVLLGDDCDDKDSEVFPGNVESLDGKDNDCDGEVDEGFASGDEECPIGYIKASRDNDSDLYGDKNGLYYCVEEESVGEGMEYVVDKTDCNDSDPLIHPGYTELQDGKDNDCDGKIDESSSIGDGDGTVCGSGYRFTYEDLDLDLYGGQGGCYSDTEIYNGSFTQIPGDCNDNNPLSYPGAEEIPNDGEDNNCDGAIDEGTEIVRSKSYVNGVTYDFTDGIFVTSGNCTSLKMDILVYGSESERDYMMSSDQIVRIYNADNNSYFGTYVFNEATGFSATNSDSNGYIKFRIEPDVICSYFTNTTSNPLIGRIRIRYELISQESDVQDSFIVRYSDSSNLDSRPKGVPLSTNVPDGVRITLYPKLFEHLSESIENEIVEEFYERGIKTGSSVSSAENSTNYDDVQFRIWPLKTANTPHYRIELEASGLYIDDPCSGWIYIYKPKLRFNFGLRKAADLEYLAGQSWADFSKHNTEYYSYTPSGCGDSSVVWSKISFSDITSNYKKNFHAHDGQFASTAYGLYLFLNNTMPEEESDIEGTSNIFNGYVDGELFGDGVGDYPLEQLLAALSLGLNKNDLLRNRLRLNDLEYNNKNTGASLEYLLAGKNGTSVIGKYVSAWPDAIESDNSLSMRRFYTYGGQDESGNHGDVVGALDYFINSLFTFAINPIIWFTPIKTLSWGIKLGVTDILADKNSFVNFITYLGGYYDGNEQKLIPLQQTSISSPKIDEVPSETKLGFSISSDIAQQFFTAMVKTGMWDVKNILNFDLAPEIEKVDDNIVYLNVKNFIFGGDFEFDGKRIGEFFRTDAQARVIVQNDLNINQVEGSIENYLQESVDNDWVIAIHAKADIIPDDITYIEPMDPKYDDLEYNYLQYAGSQSVYYILRWLSCYHFKDASESSESLDGWDFMIPMDDGGWALNYPGVPLTKQNYCKGEQLDWYAKDYIIYFRYKDMPWAQIILPKVLSEPVYPNQLNFITDVEIYDIDEFVDLSDGGSSSGSTCSNPDDEIRCIDPN